MERSLIDDQGQAIRPTEGGKAMSEVSVERSPEVEAAQREARGVLPAMREQAMTGLPSIRDLMPAHVAAAVPEGIEEGLLPLCWSMFQAGELRTAGISVEQVERITATMQEIVRTMNGNGANGHRAVGVHEAHAQANPGARPQMNLTALTDPDAYNDDKGAPGQAGEVDVLGGSTGDGEGFVDDDDEEGGADDPAESAPTSNGQDDDEVISYDERAPKVPTWLVAGLIKFAQAKTTDPVLAEQIVLEVLNRKINIQKGGTLPGGVGKIIVAMCRNRGILIGGGSNRWVESSQGRVEDLTDGAASTSANHMHMSELAAKEGL